MVVMNRFTKLVVAVTVLLLQPASSDNAHKAELGRAGSNQTYLNTLDKIIEAATSKDISKAVVEYNSQSNNNDRLLGRCWKVGSTGDRCRSQNVVYLPTGYGNHRAMIRKGSKYQVVKVTKRNQSTWYCGRHRERFANGRNFNQVRVHYSRRGKIRWNFYECLSATPPKDEKNEPPEEKCKAAIRYVDKGYADNYRGYYDVQGCGKCYDYCRWVGNSGPGGNPAYTVNKSSSWWSCALAGSKKIYSSRTHFKNGFPYKKCSGKGAYAPVCVPVKKKVCRCRVRLRLRHCRRTPYYRCKVKMTNKCA